MLSRRNALIGGTAAVAATLVERPGTLLAAASQPATKVAFGLPAGACDCHTHIFGDPARFPFVPTRSYTPEVATVPELQELHRALGVARVVIVQPSVYGTDNACTLDAIKQLGARARGVAVVDDKTSETALDEMGRGGIRGIRLNLQTAGVTDPAVARERLVAVAERIRRRQWHIQINTQLSVIEAIKDAVMAATVPIVIDHLGGAQAALGVEQPGFAALLNLVRAGKVHVKLSAVYLSSTQKPDFADVAPLARALIAANPERILWGTDWPHPDSSRVAGRKATDLTPMHQIDDGRVLNQLTVWAPDAAQRKMILVDNPAKLYGFSP